MLKAGFRAIKVGNADDFSDSMVINTVRAFHFVGMPRDVVFISSSHLEMQTKNSYSGDILKQLK